MSAEAQSYGTGEMLDEPLGRRVKNLDFAWEVVIVHSPLFRSVTVLSGHLVMQEVDFTGTKVAPTRGGWPPGW